MPCPNGCTSPAASAVEAAAHDAASTPWRDLADALGALASAAAVHLPGRAFDPYLVEWAQDTRARLEHVAEEIGEEAACDVAAQIAAALLFVARRPDLARRIIPQGIRHDAMCMAADLADGARTIAKEPIVVPLVQGAGPNVAPGAPGQAFDVATGEPKVGAASLAPFPARQIVHSARRGDPHARRFVAGAVELAPVDPTFANVLARLQRGAKLQDRSDFKSHYLGVARLGGIR